jgi:hypothetical protein
MPAIIATWEAKIGKIKVPGQPRERSFGDLISTSNWRKWQVLVMPVIAGSLKEDDQDYHIYVYIHTYIYIYICICIYIYICGDIYPQILQYQLGKP